MTLPDSPLTTLWHWVARAPLPVVIALVVALGLWVRMVDDKASDAATKAAVAMESHLIQARRLENMDAKLDRLLEAAANARAAIEAHEKSEEQMNRRNR